MNQQQENTGGRMPVLFVGHGSPMNVLEGNRWSQGFAALRDLVPKPTAIVAISAHWFVDGTYLTGSARPETIHNFSGLPRALYEIDYSAPGKIDLARRLRGMLGEERAALTADQTNTRSTMSGSPDDLPEDLRERERASRARRPQAEFVFTEAWAKPL